MFAACFRFAVPADADMDGMRKLMKDRAKKFHGLPGLRSKAFLVDSERREIGGNYVWQTRESLDSYLRSDPPSAGELEKLRRHVEGTFEGLRPPAAASAVAVGGTATSLRRLVGAELEHETLERGIRVLSTTPIAEVAERFELDAERVRLLPAGILILEAISDLLGLPLRIARGGLREGILLELVEGRKLG